MSTAMKTAALRGALLASAWGLSVPVLAQHAAAPPRLMAKALGKDWVTVGGALLHGPAYAGSDESRTRLLPAIEAQWASGWFAGFQSGVGYDWGERPGQSYGLRVLLDMGRKEDRSAALEGLGDVPRRPLLGAFATWHLSRNTGVGAALNGGSGENRDGWVLDLSMHTGWALSPGLRLGLAAHGVAANAAWMQTWHGVDAEQAARSGYATYTPGGGVQSARLSASVNWRPDPRWTVLTSVSRSQLLGAAQDSPLTRQNGNTSGVLALTYTFF